LDGDDGTLDQSGIISKSDCLGNKRQAFFNHIAAPSILSVVKASNGLCARFLELLERRPFLQQSAGHGRGQIIAAEFQRLGKVSFEQCLELIGEPGAHVHAATPA